MTVEVIKELTPFLNSVGFMCGCVGVMCLTQAWRNFNAS